MHAELGSFMLEHKPSSLQASVHSSVELLAAPDSLFKLESRSDVLQDIRDVHLWIARHHAFTLELRVCGSGTQSLGRAFEAVREAKLWKQMDLQPTAIEITRHDEETSLLLRLEHDEDPTETPPNRLHKLSIDASESDLRPPTGIETLSAPHFLLQLQLSEGRPTPCSYDGSHDEEDVPPFIMAHEEHEMEDFDGARQHDLLCEEELFLLHHNPLASFEACYETDRDTSNTSASMLHPTGFVTRGEEDAGNDGPLEALDRATLAILDATLRFAILDKPKKLHAGIVVRDDARLVTWHGLAPSIWGPGYLRSMMERACFVPTLSRALLCTSSNSTIKLWRMLHLQMQVSAAKRSLPRLELATLGTPSAEDNSGGLLICQIGEENLLLAYDVTHFSPLLQPQSINTSNACTDVQTLAGEDDEILQDWTDAEYHFDSDDDVLISSQTSWTSADTTMRSLGGSTSSMEHTLFSSPMVDWSTSESHCTDDVELLIMDPLLEEEEWFRK